MLWQRFGRAARGTGQVATAILLVEKKDTDEARARKAEQEAKRRERKREGIGAKRKSTRSRNTKAKRSLTDGPSVNRNVSESESDDTDNETSNIDALLKARRVHYKQADQLRRTSQTSGRKFEVEHGSALYDFINAHIELKCRRIILTLYFDNDHTRKSGPLLLGKITALNPLYIPASDFHFRCDETQPTGCQRCQPRPLTDCCDLCSPLAFVFLDLPPQPTKPRAAAKSNIKPFEMSAVDCNLQTALLDWREEKALVKFPKAAVRDLGASILLSDEILNRIVECAHAKKLSSPADLYKETKWRKDWVEEFGESLLALVCHYYPPPPTTSNTSTDTRPSAVSRRAPAKCGACGATGHIS